MCSVTLLLLLFAGVLGHVSACVTFIPNNYPIKCNGPNSGGPHWYIIQAKERIPFDPFVFDMLLGFATQKNNSLRSALRQDRVSNALVSMKQKDDYIRLVRFFCEKIYLDLQMYVDIVVNYFTTEKPVFLTFEDPVSFRDVIKRMRKIIFQAPYVKLLGERFRQDPDLTTAWQNYQSSEYKQILKQFKTLPEIKLIAETIGAEVHLDEFIEFAFTVAVTFFD